MKASMVFCRQASDAIWPLCIAAILVSQIPFAHANSSYDAYFPRGQYPELSDVQPTDRSGIAPKPGLVNEIKTLSKEISDSVKEVAQKRNLTCFGDPCLVQIFPLMYSKPDSGFFGGFRARLTNISRQNPFLYIINTQVIRSDSAQWIAAVGVDVPQIELGLVRPRLKLRASYARSTEFRYTGAGPDSFVLSKRPDEDKRYSINETAAGGTLLLPLRSVDDRSFGLYGSYDYSRARNNPFESPTNSLLFNLKPEAYQGGTFRSVGFGLYLDTRPTETLTRSGGALELGATVGMLESDPKKFSYRFTLIDRRYQSRGRWTLAHRLTMDGLVGDSPFWERAGVGGIDPIRDVSGSGILKAYTGGRFHEDFKFLESLELRLHQNEFRIVGLRGDLTIMPLAIDGGLLSRLFAWSLASGLDVVWNRSFLTRFYVAFTEKEWAMRLKFSQEF
jgi:hypothetical protein